MSQQLYSGGFRTWALTPCWSPSPARRTRRHPQGHESRGCAGPLRSAYRRFLHSRPQPLPALRWLLPQQGLLAECRRCPQETRAAGHASCDPPPGTCCPAGSSGFPGSRSVFPGGWGGRWQLPDPGRTLSRGVTGGLRTAHSPRDVGGLLSPQRSVDPRDPGQGTTHGCATQKRPVRHGHENAKLSPPTSRRL